MTRTRRSPRSLSPALLALAVLCLLAMPLDYRAGARSPHPHAALQLLVELARGTLHDHGGRAPDRHVGHARERDDTRVALAQIAIDQRAHPELGLRIPARFSMTPAARQLDDDIPTLLKSSPTAKLSALPLLLATAGLVFARRLVGTLPWPRVPAWCGRTLSPELPPPRLALC